MKAIIPPVFDPAARSVSGAKALLRQLPQAASRFLYCGALLAFPFAAYAAASGDITAVSSRVSADYVRTKLADGSFQPEAFAFGEGGHLPGTAHDDTIDRLTFKDVARVIARPLAGQKYLAAKDPSQTKLLIMVYWGTTAGTAESPNAIDPMTDPMDKMIFRDQFDRIDFKNARILGYDSEGVIGTDYGRNLRGTALHLKTEDLYEEIEDNRYFVVLMAYDFQLLWKEKKHKLLWETRFSIREHRNDFGRVLPEMALFASRYFGQDTHGLLRRPLPEGHVTLGKLEIGEVVPDK